MKRIILMVLRNFFFVPGAWIKLCYYASHVENYSEKFLHDFLRYIVKKANTGGNVTLEAYGTENIPKEDGFILYPNHQGMYDMLALVGTCEHPISMVAKKEVEKVPGLKQVMSCVKGFYMDREDVRQSLKVIENVSKEVKNGRNYTIFAEGTRSKLGNELLNFKGGSFKAATRAKCPIVPVALIDSFQPFDTKDVKPVTVQVHYLKPMLYEEYKDMNTNEIAEEVKHRIEIAIAEAL